MTELDRGRAHEGEAGGVEGTVGGPHVLGVEDRRRLQRLVRIAGDERPTVGGMPPVHRPVVAGAGPKLAHPTREIAQPLGGVRGERLAPQAGGQRLADCTDRRPLVLGDHVGRHHRSPGLASEGGPDLGGVATDERSEEIELELVGVAEEQ